MYCAQCGQALADLVKFCSSCGTAVGSAGGAAASPDSPASVGPVAEESGTAWDNVLGIVFFLAIGYALWTAGSWIYDTLSGIAGPASPEHQAAELLRQQMRAP